MRHRLLSVAALAVLLVPSLVLAGGHGMNISTDEVESVSECRDIKIRFNNREAARAEEQITLPNRPLEVQASRNGGVHVVGTDRSDVLVKLCKAVSPSQDSQDLFDKMKVVVRNGVVSVDGPSGGDRDWTAFLLIHAPKGAEMTLRASNGPLALDQVAGTFHARAVNGPISIKNSTGAIDARTTNGPISLAGSSGRIHLKAENGPISVKLKGSAWDGAGLQAETENGPLSVKVASGYRSGVVIESDGHSPMACDSCEGALRTWDDDSRRIEFGQGQKIIRLSTNNGPVSVKTLRN